MAPPGRRHRESALVRHRNRPHVAVPLRVCYLVDGLSRRKARPPTGIASRSDRPMNALAALLLLFTLQAAAQSGASLRGRVADDSGAVIPGALVIATGPDGKSRTAAAGTSGNYSLTGLTAGTYSIQASSPGMSTAQPVVLELKTGVQTLDLVVKVSVTTQQLTVQETLQPTVGVEADNNASAVILRGEDLAALSDNPDDLQADLQALAGPAAGPNGGAIYIDGFSGGEIPPKEAIREIRINQDPFSPEYDKLGYGRIEIFTKPGASKYRGTVDYNLGTDRWNSRNPYAATKAPLRLDEFEGSTSGPLGKRASFTVDAQRNMVDNGSVVNAVTLDPQTLAITPFSNVFKTIQRYTRVSPRFDYALNDNNTLSARYSFTHGDIAGSGIGSFDLISRGVHTTFTNQLLQLTETAILGTAVNETRFQYFRYGLHQTANSNDPTVQVLGSFTGGGSNLGRSSDILDTFEFQNYTSVVRGVHAWKFGVRIRAGIDDNTSSLNFNGTYTFAGGTVPVLDSFNQPIGNQTQEVNSIERYRRTLLFQRFGYGPTQIRQLGGGASQFTISQGTPETKVNLADVAFFAGDNWRVRPNITLSYGLRYETQTNIHDWRDFAPRVSVAWAPGKQTGRKFVFRAGFGTFYDRFAIANTLNSQRYNGQVQQQFLLMKPDTYPAIPTGATLADNRAGQVTQLIDRQLRAPYILQAAFTVERQLSKSTTAAVTYTTSHGVHLLRSRDIGPLYTSPQFLIESTGIYNQNQIIANVNTKANKNVTLFSFYVLNKASSSTDSVNTSPANPNSYSGEYGPAATDVRHRFTLGGSITARYSIRLSPFLILQSGAPFNITSGNDQFGTSVFNARPGLASDPTRTGLIPTSYGLLDPNPVPGERILSRNYGRGPGQQSVNLRVSKTIGFGPEKGGGGGGASGAPAMSAGQRANVATGAQGGTRGLFGETAPRKYNFILSMSFRNLLNHTNPGPIIGNITSPLFARANQVAGQPNGEGFSENASNRRLEMQIRFTF